MSQERRQAQGEEASKEMAPFSYSPQAFEGFKAQEPLAQPLAAAAVSTIGASPAVQSGAGEAGGAGRAPQETCPSKRAT